VTNSLSPQLFFSDRAKSVLRGVLFVYLGLVFCPIQYLAITERTSDDTWLFALSYAAAHHLAWGRDIVWTSGPLGYLAAPMDIGNSLALGLAFQAALWILLLAILWDLFFRGCFPLQNLAFFSICLGLSGFMYHQFPNPLGAGDLLFVGALILLVHFRLRGGSGRFVTALVMLGLVPLIKFVGMILGVMVVAGLIVDFIMPGRSSTRREALLAAVLPGLVAGAGFWLNMGSFHALALYFKGSLELSRGYNLAMSLPGRSIELLAGFEVLVLFAAALVLLAIRDRRMAGFFILLLAAPVLVYFKHGFVRQDLHIVYAFCFVAVAVGLVALATVLDGGRPTTAWAVLVLLLAVLCQDYAMTSGGLGSAVPFVTGVKVPALVWHVLRFGRLRQMLNAETQRSFSSDQLSVEPEIKAIIQQEPVASLSMSYSGVFVDGLNLQLYPVIQRYSAYTPYLDQLNADWIRDRGPRFLLFDGKPLLGKDQRQPWTETPAMWVEVYRWYDTRMLGARNLLLERRGQPRFQKFELLSHSQLRFGDELLMPPSQQPVFWSLRCSLTTAGKLRLLLLRVGEIMMTVHEKDRQWDPLRVLPEVLASPSLGNYLPSDLSEFAQVFSPTGIPNFHVDKLSLSGPGQSAYAPVCEVELLRPAR
jgi:hypothetical protein